MARKSKQSYWDSDAWYPPSQPRHVDGGMKATTKRGAFGASWWAKRWIAVLEGFGWESRLQRGRTYARKGQVLSIEVTSGVIKAKVQGSAAKPYSVTIRIPPLTDEQWADVLAAVAQQALFAAQLLGGEMPPAIEEVFDQVGIPLFPRTAYDVETRCSCPDAANPCKHSAAVYYLVGEQFDADPFLVFQLRGRTKTAFLAALRERHRASIAPAAVVDATPPHPALHDLLEHFYESPNPITLPLPSIEPPTVEAPLLIRYGPPPAATEHELRRLYRMITTTVLEQVFGAEDE